jgi:uncharacterized SAM-binding protein YcdF (DUF218 family)
VVVAPWRWPGRVLRLGRWWTFAVVLGTVVGVYLAATVVSVWRTATADRARPAQAIVVLGAAQYDGQPSPVLERRLDRAAELYGEGLAPLVVVTGGRASGDRFTEATASANYLIARGVPDTAILRETTGRSTWESIVATARFLRERAVTSVVLVSDGYHLTRARGIADDVGLDASTSPADADARPPIGRVVQEAVAVGTGRIIGFGRMSRLFG